MFSEVVDCDGTAVGDVPIPDSWRTFDELLLPASEKNRFNEDLD